MDQLNTMVLVGKKNRRDVITLRCMTDSEVQAYTAKWAGQYNITVTKAE